MWVAALCHFRILFLSMRIGALEILPVIDGTFHHPPMTTYAGGEPGDAWAPHRYLLDDDGNIESTLGGFLVRHDDNDRVVLVDLGLGDNDMMGMRGGGMLQSLEALGVHVEDVTDVVFTHLHLDHIGWATVDGAPVFPNATYRCDAADWQHWVADPSVGGTVRVNRYLRRQQELMEPTAGRVETWDADGPIAPGIDVVRIPGHTPGSSLVVLSDAGQRAMLLGDVVHCAVELLDDEWDGFADVDPVLARTARNALARELEGEDVPVAAAHFPGLQFGRVLTGEQHRRFEFIG
jgi:glyoxylase-like metal-dependent hydrolase (beta-lactamase superfamily II)